MVASVHPTVELAVGGAHTLEKSLRWWLKRNPICSCCPHCVHRSVWSLLNAPSSAHPFFPPITFCGVTLTVSSSPVGSSPINLLFLKYFLCRRILKTRNLTSEMSPSCGDALVPNGVLWDGSKGEWPLNSGVLSSHTQA